LTSAPRVTLHPPDPAVTDALRRTDTLNGGRLADLEQADWALIRPYLEENEALFGIPVPRLLTFDGEERPFHRIYRKAEVGAKRTIPLSPAQPAHAST